MHGTQTHISNWRFWFHIFSFHFFSSLLSLSVSFVCSFFPFRFRATGVCFCFLATIELCPHSVHQYQCSSVRNSRPRESDEWTSRFCYYNLNNTTAPAEAATAERISTSTTLFLVFIFTSVKSFLGPASEFFCSSWFWFKLEFILEYILDEINRKCRRIPRRM